MEEILKPELVEAIVMSATVGQFGQQLCEETFNEVWKKFDTAKVQLVNTAVSGGSALTTYILTQETFVPKTAMIALLAGIFATTALKLLKKKNQNQNDKIDNLVKKIDEQEKVDKDLRIIELEKKIAELQNK